MSIIFTERTECIIPSQLASQQEQKGNIFIYFSTRWRWDVGRLLLFFLTQNVHSSSRRPFLVCGRACRHSLPTNYHYNLSLLNDLIWFVFVIVEIPEKKGNRRGALGAPRPGQASICVENVYNLKWRRCLVTLFSRLFYFFFLSVANGHIAGSIFPICLSNTCRAG